MIMLVPPFQATSMSELYSKVTKGHFQKISSIYSADLSRVVNSMLKINPNERPSCAQILEMPEVKRNMSHQMRTIEVLRASTNSDELLKTIKLPMGRHNFHKITEQLPKPNYEDANLKRYASESASRFGNLQKENNYRSEN
jgi:NIMA (never in mitosis gene a)-related kinase